jgi:hypothetical protein
MLIPSSRVHLREIYESSRQKASGSIMNPSSLGRDMFSRMALSSQKDDQKVLSPSLSLVTPSASPQEQSTSTTIWHMLTCEKFAFREWMNRFSVVIQNEGEDYLK